MGIEPKGSGFAHEAMMRGGKRMKQGNVSGWTAAVAILALVSATRAQEADSVVGSRGTATFGTITEMSPTEISISSPTGDKKFSVNEVRKVTFKHEPRELRNARNAIDKDRFESARSMLEEIDTDDISRSEILQEIDFYKALCDTRLSLTGGGDKAAAVRALRAFEKNPAYENSYHHYEVIELLGELAMALASFENAVEYYGKLSEAPWPEYKIRAYGLQADALVASEQYAAAIEKYDQVLNSSLDDAETRQQKLRATLGKAVCLAETGQPDQGISNVLEVIEQNDSRDNPQLFARAYNALGTCYLRADKPEDALLAFLHVDLLFNRPPAAHAEALYHLSKLWRAMNRAERANRARSVLVDRYSGSRWANRK
ncbi:MAG: tetratricopeptide repeat protein [Planctomycetota bacterium]